MSEYDKQRDIEAEGQRAAIYHNKPKCPKCGLDNPAHHPCDASGTLYPCFDPFHAARSTHPWDNGQGPIPRDEDAL